MKKFDKSGRPKCSCGHSIFSHRYIDKAAEPCNAKHCTCRKFDGYIKLNIKGGSR